MLRTFLAVVLMLCLVYAVYVAADRYLRLDERRRLERRHAEGEGGGLNREDFVQKGMAEYERSTEKKLLVGLFAIPILVMVFLALLAN